MSKYLVFDIGGSSVKHAIITEEGEFISQKEITLMYLKLL